MLAQSLELKKLSLSSPNVLLRGQHSVSVTKLVAAIGDYNQLQLYSLKGSVLQASCQVVSPTVTCRGDTHASQQRSSVTQHARLHHMIFQVNRVLNITDRKPQPQRHYLKLVWHT